MVQSRDAISFISPSGKFHLSMLPPLPTPLCSEWDCLYLPYIDPSLLHPQMSSWNWFQIWGVCWFNSEVGLLTEIHTLFGLSLDSLICLEWSSGVKQRINSCVTVEGLSGVKTGNNHLQKLTRNRKKKKLLISHMFSFCISRLFWFMMKCNGCLNKDMSLFWR